MESDLGNRLKTIETKLEKIEATTLKIRKVQKTQASVRAVYWVFIILLGLGAFYFVQPYINQLKGTYEAIGGNGQSFDHLLDQFQGQDN